VAGAVVAVVAGGKVAFRTRQPDHRLATVGGVRNAIVIGVVTRTGSAVAVALSGSAAAPRFATRTEVALLPPGLTAQPYHAAADMDPEAAASLIAGVERAAEKAATAGLRALADMLPGREVRGVAVVVKAVSVPDNLADILRSHAWMHAAEGELYRQAVLAAASDTAAGPHTRSISQRCRPWSKH